MERADPTPLLGRGRNRAAISGEGVAPAYPIGPSRHPVSGCFGSWQASSNSMPREAQRRRAARYRGLGVDQRLDVGLLEPGLQPGLEDGDPVGSEAVDRVLHQLAQPGPSPLADRGRGAGGRRRRIGLVRPVGGPAVPLLGQAEAAGQAGDDRTDRPVLDPVLLVAVELVELIAHLGDAVFDSSRSRVFPAAPQIRAKRASVTWLRWRRPRRAFRSALSRAHSLSAVRLRSARARCTVWAWRAKARP